MKLHWFIQASFRANSHMQKRVWRMYIQLLLKKNELQVQAMSTGGHIALV